MNDALLSQVAWIGDKYLNGPVRGIVLEFAGLGTTGMKGGRGRNGTGMGTGRRAGRRAVSCSLVLDESGHPGVY